MEEILEKTENLRILMHKLALEKGISDPQVLKVSQRLDNVINECYKENKKCVVMEQNGKHFVKT